VSEYQNAAYGDVYLTRLAQVLKAEQQADVVAAHAYAATNEMARWLGLWMAFDDIIRVAELKSRASRSSRVRQESKAQASDLLKVFDHFKPGMPEFAALLPLPIAKYLLAWDRKRVQRGLEPFAIPLKLGSHTVLGMLALRILAALKHVRKFGSRYAEEQALITQWVDAVVAGLQEDWQLGYELALCGRLIKGYGTTNLRGKENLLHVINHLVSPAFGTATARAAAIRQARDAALQDEAGSALDQTLIQLGAPARPVKEQPIRWIPRTKN
jgi:indolepyruvate ferredoxin oxidoreductase beta subunit